MAYLVSRAMTDRSGLSSARLLNLWYTAISYQPGSFFPQYLASAAIEFSVNFTTFEALWADTLEMLHASLNWGWRQGADVDSNEMQRTPHILYLSVESYVGNRQDQCGVFFGGWNLPTATTGQRPHNPCALLARLSSQPSENIHSEEGDNGETAVETSMTVGTARAARKKRKKGAEPRWSVREKRRRAGNQALQVTLKNRTKLD